MVRLEFNAARVERITFEPQSRIESDFDDAAYRLVRPLINQIDSRLRKAAREALEKTQLPK